eukprot:6113879-Pyramimonas_sp.AAC.1
MSAGRSRNFVALDSGSGAWPVVALVGPRGPSWSAPWWPLAAVVAPGGSSWPARGEPSDDSYEAPWLTLSQVLAINRAAEDRAFLFHPTC